MNQRKAIIGTVALVLTSSLTACGSVDEIVSEFDEKNYQEALAIYNSKELNEKNTEKLSKEMSARIEEGVTAYANNNCTYEEINELLSTVNSMNMSSLTASLATASASVKSLSISKENYINGCEAFNDEDYPAAYNYFVAVKEEDAYFAEASDYMSKCTTNYCDAIRTQVSKHISGNEFDEALNYLGQCSFSSFDDTITTVIDELTEEVRVEYIIADAEEYVDAQDVASALTLISDSIEEYEIENTGELDKYYDTISTDYIKMITEKVSVLCEQQNYILALNMLSNAQEVIDADEFKTAVEQINAVKPTYLYDLKYSTSNRYEVVDSGDSLVDTIGNTYAVGNLFELSSDNDGWNTDVGSVEYNLGYNYQYLTGVIAVDDISDDATGTFKIEGDGVVLSSIALSRTTTPVPVSIDVSNVNWLKFSITDPSGGEIYAIMSDFKFGDENLQQTTEVNDEPATEPQTTEPQNAELQPPESADMTADEAVVVQ